MPHLHLIAIRAGADAIGVIRRQLAGIDEMAAEREACCMVVSSRSVANAPAPTNSEA